MLQFFLHRAAAAVTAAAALSGAGSLTATATRTAPAAAALSGSGSLSATATRTAFASASLSGSGSLSAAAKRETFVAAALSGTGSLSATPATDVLIIDDGDAEFATVGVWVPVSGSGYSNDYRYNEAGSGSDTATWTFTGLSAGTYRVSATWIQNANRATDAPYTVYDNTTALGTVDVNQENAPNDRNDAGVWWDDLGEFAISSGTLKVVLTDDANQFVIADAIRVELISTPSTLYGAASLSGSGSLTAAATRTAFAAASLSGTGSLSASADVQGTQTAAASLSGTGSLTATATQQHFAAASLSGAGSLTAIAEGTIVTTVGHVTLAARSLGTTTLAAHARGTVTLGARN